MTTFESPVVSRTRLVPPRVRPESIVRTDLLDSFTTSSATLTTIFGPAGSGKSTLMAQLYASVPHGVWLSADPTDNDPAVFWWSLVESIRTVIPGFAHEYRHRLLTTGRAVLEEFVTTAANELAERNVPLHLFLDDLHHVEELACRRSLHSLIVRLPEGIRLAFASRDESLIPLAKLRVEGNVLEISRDDLAMTVDEAASMMKALDARLHNDDVKRLVQRTEGWPAGLQLAALACSGSMETTALVESFDGTDRSVSDYLISEVLDRMEADERRFMLETSVLRRMSGDLCDAVTGQGDGAERLRSLERANAFVLRLDRVGAWFRYHHLFADLLFSRLREGDSGLVRELHTKAFEWHRNNGPIDEAIHHALMAGLRTEAADLVCASWFELVNAGRIETVQRLIDHFEPAELLSYQPLTIAAAFVSGLAGDDRTARRLLDAAEHTSFDGTPPDGATSMKSALAVARGSLALDGVSQGLTDSELAYGLEPPGSQWRALAALSVGLARVMKGDVVGSTTYLQEASASDDPGIRAYALAELSHGHLDRGNREQALLIAEDACLLIQESGLEDLIMEANAQAALALASLALDDQDRAWSALEAASRPMQFVGQALPVDAMRAQVLLTQVASALGEYDIARDYINRATRLATMVAETGALSGQLARLRTEYANAGIESPSGTPALPFTERELEVLQLLPTRLTTRQIGEELFLSRNTIKTYIRSAYRKLEVSTREEAIERARGLGLIAET